MDITRHRYQRVSKSAEDRWADKCEEFRRLRSGSRHEALMSLVWAGYNAGHTDEADLYQAVYQAYGDDPDENDIAGTVKAVLRMAGESTGGQPKTACGHARHTNTAKLDRMQDEHKAEWQAWVDGILKSGYEVPEAGDAEDQALADRGLAASGLAVMRGLVGELAEGETVFAGTMYSDKHASSYLKPDWKPVGEYMRTYWVPNPLKGFERTNANVSRVRFVLAEIDEPLQKTDLKPHTAEWMDEMQRQQAALWTGLMDSLPVASIVSSGSKSLHVLLAVDGTAEEFEKVRERLVKSYTLLHFDRACLDVARKTRLPYGVRKFVEGEGGILTDYDDVRRAHDQAKKMGKDMRKGKETLAKAGLEYKVSMTAYKTVNRLQDVLYVNDKVAHVSLVELADKLDAVADGMFPGESNFEKAIREGKAPEMGPQSLADYLEYRHMRVWRDVIAREDRCEGMTLDEPLENAMLIRDDWGGMFGKWPSEKTIQSSLHTLLLCNQVNPVADWLDGLVWDGKDHYHEVYDFLGIQDGFDKILIRKWLMQTAMLPFNGPDHKYPPEGVLTLAGKQGIGKTSFFRCLVPESRREDWFNEGMTLDTGDKDSLINTLRGWIGEVAEADSTTRKEQSDLKSFLTNPVLKIREPYSRASYLAYKHCSLGATVNRIEFLRDDTGNRRWWAVMCGNIDVKGLYAWDPTQLWAQVMRDWQSGDESVYRLTTEERAYLDSRNYKQFMDRDGYDELIRVHYDFEAPQDQWKKVRLAEIAETILPESKDTGKAIQIVGRTLRKMGLEPIKSSVTYFRIPPERRFGESAGETDGEETDGKKEIRGIRLNVEEARKAHAESSQSAGSDGDVFFGDAPDAPDAKPSGWLSYKSERGVGVPF